jgi:hypothetical protein
VKGHDWGVSKRCYFDRNRENGGRGIHCGKGGLGALGLEPSGLAVTESERAIWVETRVVERLTALRQPGESYSDVILRIAGRGGRVDG